MSTETEIEGVLERILYHNEDSHFCIGELSTEAGPRITFTARLPGVQCGETLVMQGGWTDHPKYGRQFEAKSFRAKLPASVNGIRKYLGSGLVTGIGRKYAEKIVDRFGADTLRIIEEDSGRLREVEGIGAKRARQIKEAWDANRAMRETFLFLQSYGVPVGASLRLVSRFGNQAIQVLQNDPYLAAREVDGIGFKTADRIALNLGIASDSNTRIQAGILHVLREGEATGNTGFPEALLLEKAALLLDGDHEKIQRQLNAMLRTQLIVLSLDEAILQRPEFFYCERSIARRLHALISTPSNWPSIRVDTAVEWAQDRAGIQFAEGQRRALEIALRSKCMVITGGPGTGKTTILRSLVAILQAKRIKVTQAAPTGRAAQRMAESTGHQATTLHRLLKYDPATHAFHYNEENPFKTGCLIVDESSMLDASLASATLRALENRAHLIIVGDTDQLPSVGAGHFLHDVISARLVPVVQLDQIFRQREGSEIVTTAYAILGGSSQPPHAIGTLRDLDPSREIQFVSVESAEDAAAGVTYLAQRWLPQQFPQFDVFRDLQVLTPMHRGEAGIRSLNERLQEALNPDGDSLVLGGTTLRLGDRVMQTRNNHEKGVFNGDVGIITAIHAGSASVEVNFSDTEVELLRPEAADLTLAYAASIHKSQGSEYPLVVVVLLKQHYMLLQRNLLYTAITRGKHRIIILGEPAAYSMAVRNAESQKRHTGLIAHLHAQHARLS